MSRLSLKCLKRRITFAAPRKHPPGASVLLDVAPGVGVLYAVSLADSPALRVPLRFILFTR